MRFLSVFSFVVAIGLPAPAFAHWGHVGELAGHGHVIAVGALIGAAALAAALLKPKGDETAEEIDADDVEEPEGEAA